MKKNKNKLMFICSDKGCGYKFASNEYDTVDFPEREDHPFDYHSKCLICDEPANLNPVQLNLFKAWVATRKPREGQALANIREGNKHRDTSLNKFNALTHGLYARVARFFPAREGKYAACETCEYLNNGCGQISPVCLKRAELFMQFEIAVETKDANMLNKLMSDTQAGLMAIQTDMMAEIAQTGVVIHEPVTYNDKESGKLEIAEFKNKFTGEMETLTEMRDHPLLKRLIEFVQKNNQTLADLQMTQRQQKSERSLKPFFDDEDKDKSAAELRQRKALFAERQAILFNVGTEALQGAKNIGEPLLINPEKKEGE